MKTRKIRQMIALVLALVLVIGTGVSASAASKVTIKTQKAADSIENGIRGIDVSKWQGEINWKKVAGENVKFAMIRSTCGPAYDPMFIKNAKAAHQNGLKVGAYHYATFKDRSTMEAEAKLFVAALKQVDITYPVALDVEFARGMSKSTLTTLSIEFMDIVQKAGYKVMLYSYQNFFDKYYDLGRLADHQLWVTNYIEKPARLDHGMWQHTSYGKVSGISGNVDINIAYADLSSRKFTVSKTISDDIKQTLNDRYGTSINMDKLDMSEVNGAVARAIQMEINRQWDADLDVTAELSAQEISYLGEINFTSETRGWITYLTQVKLFYKGHYTGELTASFDDNTVEAIRQYQSKQNLSTTGDLDYDTLANLFTV